ncbi:MAG: hypothetical protein HY719_05605 [Planctomycetes bacterium]|nr:hypothetical protein [Planctomycetota bacterium]
MTLETERMFGQIAMAEGMISRAQLDECLSLQKGNPAYQGDPIGEVMVRKHYLTETQRQEVLRLQGFFKIAEEAELFGAVAVALGKINEAQMLDCLRAQRDQFRATKQWRPIEEIIADKGFLTPRELDHVLGEAESGRHSGDAGVRAQKRRFENVLKSAMFRAAARPGETTGKLAAARMAVPLATAGALAAPPLPGPLGPLGAPPPQAAGMSGVPGPAPATTPAAEPGGGGSTAAAVIFMVLFFAASGAAGWLYFDRVRGLEESLQAERVSSRDLADKAKAALKAKSDAEEKVKQFTREVEQARDLRTRNDQLSRSLKQANDEKSIAENNLRATKAALEELRKKGESTPATTGGAEATGTGAAAGTAGAGAPAGPKVTVKYLEPPASASAKEELQEALVIRGPRVGGAGGNVLTFTVRKVKETRAPLKVEIVVYDEADVELSRAPFTAFTAEETEAKVPLDLRGPGGRVEIVVGD